MEKMTKEKLKSLIEEAIKNYDIELQDIDRPDAMLILNYIEQNNDDLMYDLIDYDAHPIAIQCFTNVRFKEKNRNIIVDFGIPLGNNIDDRVETLMWDYEMAYKTKETFNS